MDLRARLSPRGRQYFELLYIEHRSVQSVAEELLADARRLDSLPNDRLVLLFRRTAAVFIDLALSLDEEPDGEVVRLWREVGAALGPEIALDRGGDHASSCLVARECAIALALRSLSSAYDHDCEMRPAAAGALRRIHIEIDAAVLAAG